jgi:hypothetical protein
LTNPPAEQQEKRSLLQLCCAGTYDGGFTPCQKNYNRNSETFTTYMRNTENEEEEEDGWSYF